MRMAVLFDFERTASRVELKKLILSTRAIQVAVGWLTGTHTLPRPKPTVTFFFDITWSLWSCV